MHIYIYIYRYRSAFLSGGTLYFYLRDAGEIALPVRFVLRNSELS